MGSEGLGGLGDVRAAAVHKEIYGAQRVFSAPGEKKDLQGTPSRDRDPQGMGSHTDWGCPEGQGAGGRGWACHVTGGRVSVPPRRVSRFDCHRATPALAAWGISRRRSGDLTGGFVERAQGELRLGTLCACMAAGGPIPPCPGSWRLSACPHLQCRRAHMCDIDDTLMEGGAPDPS